MATSAAATAGFWSYTHRDDEAESGRLRRLAGKVKTEYALLTDEQLELFIDRDLEWGEEWRARIGEALARTTFFVPVITPRYFASQECRRELLQFAGHAKSLGVSDLLLPLYYVTVPRLDDEGDESEDEAIALVSSMQRFDWRDLRLESEDSAAYRKGVNALAARLASVAAEVADRDVARLPTVGAEGDEDGAGPGVLELVAEAEDAWPKVTAALEGFTPEFEQVSEITNAAGPRIERAAGKGAGPALVVLRKLAGDLSGPASRIHELGKVYAAELVRIHPAVLSLLRFAETGLWADADALAMIASIQGLHEAADEVLPQLQGLTTTLDQVGSLSKDIREPLKQMREGLRDVIDGRTILDEWERRASEVEALIQSRSE